MINNLEDQRVRFESVFPMPSNCIWTGEGYAVTAYNAWDANDYCQKWVGWIACLQTFDPMKQDAYLSWAFDNINKKSVQKEWLLHVLKCCGTGGVDEIKMFIENTEAKL